VRRDRVRRGTEYAAVSIYDYKNMFLDGSPDMTDSNLLYVGTSKSETDYAYMKPGPSGAGFLFLY
jgi:hypothetical protein